MPELFNLGPLLGTCDTPVVRVFAWCRTTRAWPRLWTLSRAPAFLKITRTTLRLRRHPPLEILAVVRSSCAFLQFAWRPVR